MHRLIHDSVDRRRPKHYASTCQLDDVSTLLPLFFLCALTDNLHDPSFSNVAAKAYRTLALFEPGNYQAKLSYYGNQETVRHRGDRALDRISNLMTCDDQMTSLGDQSDCFVHSRSLTGPSARLVPRKSPKILLCSL